MAPPPAGRVFPALLEPALEQGNADRRRDPPDNAVYIPMQAVGADHLVEAGREAGVDVSGPTALRDLFWRAVEAGHGGDGLSSVITAIRDPRPAGDA